MLMTANGTMTKKVDMEFTLKLMERNMRAIGRMIFKMAMVRNISLMAQRIKVAIIKE